MGKLPDPTESCRRFVSLVPCHRRPAPWGVAYDEDLANRVREALGGTKGVRERKMFGGLAFMVHGNMACGIVGDELMVRVGPEAYEQALSQPHAREMDFTGRSMKGMVYVAADGVKNGRSLKAWVERGLGYATSLPPR